MPDSPPHLDALRAQLGAPVPDDLLQLALTHPSVPGETAAKTEARRTLESNQRLEFLGDAVVGMIVAEHLYRTGPELPEGALTQRKAAVVQGRSLAQAARRLGLGAHLRLGRGEENSGGRERDTILSDAFESVTGALFLAQGFEATRDFVLRALGEEIAAVSGQSANVKNRLQEHTQAIGLGTPVYRTTATGTGPGRRFDSAVVLGDEVRGQGRGRTKKEAECQAAQEALAALTPAEAPPESA